MLVVVAAGCGSTNNATTATSTSTAPAAATQTTSAASAPTTSAPASTTAATAAGLSGTWSGQYGGAYQGTFNLTWRQSGTNLSDTIKLSAPADTLSIHGTMSSGAISFGTVGSLAITYSGSVSGNSMSGGYKVGGSTGGSWSANKIS